MKVAAILGENKAGLVDKPDPKAKGEFVVVRVHAVPMCTEYKAYKGGKPCDCLGHEAAGEVVEVAQSGTVKVGDRVVVQPMYACGKCPLCLNGDHIHCQHGRNLREETGCEAGSATYAQFLLKQDWLLSPIPDGLTYSQGGMACCGLGATFGALLGMNVNALDTVLITGLGPVGLGAVITSHFLGARVIAIESHPYRASLAKNLGADEVLAPEDGKTLQAIMDLTHGVGVDKAVDCSGAPQARRLLVDAARRKGEVAFVGEGGDLTLDISRDTIRKGLVLRGSWHYNLGLYPRLAQVLLASKRKLGKFVTHTLPMSKVRDAWELQLTGNCGKVVLDPWA